MGKKKNIAQYREKIAEAAMMVLRGEATCSEAAKTYELPWSTVKNAAERLKKPIDKDPNVRHGSQVLSATQRDELANYIKYSTKHGFFVDTKMVLTLVDGLITSSGLPPWTACHRLR